METIADRILHIGCSLTAIAACSNSPCKKSIVFGMHETAKRLLDLGRSRGAKDFTEIAKSLGGSDQSATNWKTRGVPKAVMIEAARKYHIDVGWLTGDAHAVEPVFITRWREGTGWTAPVRPTSSLQAEQGRQAYNLSENEQLVLDGFRLAHFPA